MVNLRGIDQKLMIKQHRDFLFYDHGFGEHIESRFDRYGLFLEDGDFEKWQPVCYMNKDGDEFKNHIDLFFYCVLLMS